MAWYSYFNKVTNTKWFDQITGAVALANPLALVPGVWAIAEAPTAEGHSVMMWIIFLIMQANFVLVGAKARHAGTVLAMVGSMIMSGFAIWLLINK